MLSTERAVGKMDDDVGNESSSAHDKCLPEREHDEAQGGGEGPDLGAVEWLPEV